MKNRNIPNKRLHANSFLRPLLIGIAALSLFPILSRAQSNVLLGPPNYRIDVDVAENRQYEFYSEATGVAGRGGYRSGGPVSLRQVAPTVTPINVPTLGEARSTDSAIGTLAQAGAFFGPNSGSPAPFARARATAEVTRFFEFNSLNPTVPIDFEYLLTGGLRHQRDNRSSGASLASSLEMNLEILDDSLSVIATPLRVFVTATGVNGNTLAVNTYGSQVDRDWVVSNIEFQDNTASNTSYLRDLLWDVRVLERVENGFQAPVGVPVGFRWSFESFAEVTNYTRTDALGNIAESNFLNTLTLPEATFEISASDTGSSSFSEIAVIPEPRALVIIYLLPVVLLLRRPPSTTRRAR